MQSTTDTSNKISVKQLIIVLVVMSISPAERFLPVYAARNAAEAGWITPIAALPPILLTIYFMQKIFNKYKNKSTAEIIKDILGKYIGTIALSIHFFWILYIIGFYIRHHAERLVSSIYPNIDINIFIVVTTIIIAYILRFGETAIARMGEILFPILFILITFIMLLLLSNIRLDALLPIAFSDAIPIIRGSVGTLSVFCFIFVMFFFGDDIVGKQNTMKLFTKGSVVLLIMISMILFTTFGILGPSVTSRAPIPFLITVKQISIADTIENVESVVVATWVLSDTLLISTLGLILLHIAKGIFKLTDTKNFINIIGVFIFILANGIAKSRLELDSVASMINPYINAAIGFGTPVLLFIVGKLRRKI